MKIKNLSLFWICLLLSLIVVAQSKLKPGFDPYEYKDLLEITALQVDTPWRKSYLPKLENYKLVFRSKKMAMDNRWDLWISKDSVGVISIHATADTYAAWLENLYAGMVPAEGVLKFDSASSFTYKFANLPNAYVHVGWLIAISAIGPSVVEKINEYYLSGIKDYLIVGHSQGAAIASLLRSYLYYSARIPDNITFKTYCSAAPKPGNQFYAYDFDFITANGWAFRIINTDDWVPEMPFCIQTIKDVSELNPFSQSKSLFKQIKPLPRVIARRLYKSLTNKSIRAQKKWTRYLACKVYHYISKNLVEFEEPEYAQSFEYMPCGSPVILMPTKEYYNKFPDGSSGTDLFVHHMPRAYMFLLKQHYLKENP